MPANKSLEVHVILEVAKSKVQIEPATLKEALEGRESEMWNLAIRDVFNSLYENNTWILIPRTPNMHVITNR